MTIDAPEIARLREEVHKRAYAAWVLDLLDELEQALAERDENKWCKSKLIEMRSARDAAHALLRDCLPYAEGWPSLRVRLAKFLGDA